MKKLLVVVIIVGAFAGGGYFYWKHRATGAPSYRTAVVSRADVIQTVTATGQINPVTNVTVGSQVSGIVNHIYVDFNSPVTNGQLLAEIDPSTYAAQVAEAKADLANAKAAEALAQVTLERDAKLLDKKILDQADYDSAKAALDQADAMVSIKQATLQQDNANLAYTKIFAPISGLVLSRNVDIGQTVAASFTTPTLFVIANDISKMQIDALVSEADIGSIRTNQNVNFTVDAFPTSSFHGVVTQIRNYPETNQNVVCYDAMIDVDNSEKLLRPGMTANVSIITAEKDDALRIPNPALRWKPADAADPSAQASATGDQGARGSNGGAGMSQRGGGGAPGQGRGGPGGGRGRPKPAHTVYILADDPTGKGKVPQPVQIHTGIGDGVYTEVLDGLKEGDEVISGMDSPVAAGPAAPSNPFGGGGRRF